MPQTDSEIRNQTSCVLQKVNLCLIYPHTEPPAQVHYWCQLCPLGWTNTASCILSMDNNLKHFLRCPESQVMPATTTSSDPLHLWPKILGIGSLPELPSAQQKYMRAGKKNQQRPKKTKQQPKQTKALWNCNLWISVRKWKEEACSKGSVYPLLVSQQWHWAILEHRHSFGDTKYRRAQHLWKGTEAKSPTQWVRHLLPMPCPATSQELQRPRPLQGREFKGQNAVYPCCYTFAANKCFSSPAPNAAKTLMQQYSMCVFGGSTGEFLRNHSRV